MQTLYIAEKPDMANAIAGYLWSSGGYEKETGFYRKGDVTVSWAMGHLLELAEPEDYDKRYARWENYPVFPDVWQYRVIDHSAGQFQILSRLLKTAEVVVHAGDPDREGQLLIEEILRYCNYKGKVQRLLVNAKDDVSMSRAFSAIEDNRKFANLYEAGKARTEADWLVGINLTRCYTVNASRFLPGAMWNIGRVKVPTLALVVNREKEIRNFKSKKYYELKAAFTKEGVGFTAAWQPDGNKIALDEEGRLLDKIIAETVRQKALCADGTVQNVSRKKGTEAPPLPYSLDKLQVEANARFGFSPKTVLATVQSLYEKKFVSYPRSDCNYIPQAQHRDAPRILKSLAARFVRGAAKADASLRSRAWNDTKVTAHHAIIPTGEIPAALSVAEEKIYTLIAERYAMQFYPPCEFETIAFAIMLADERFTGSGRLVLKPGFKEVFQSQNTKEQDEESRRLPNLAEGENLGRPDAVDLPEKETRPPKRFTEGTLLAAMANIYRFMDQQNPNREKLKEVKGIGTPATRDSIISELQGYRGDKKTQAPFMEKVKKELAPTELGFRLIENVDASLTKPDTTAEMEFALAEIEAGKGDLSKFKKDICDTINRNIAYAEQHRFPGYEAKVHVCPVCGKVTLRQHYSPKTKQFFFVCDDQSCVSPVTKKRAYYAPDADGEPVIACCPHDQAQLEKKKGPYGFFWSCPRCRVTFKDSKGRPKM